MSNPSIARPRTQRTTVTRCHVCGFAEVRTDEVVEYELVLAECPRCEHRWTGRAAPVVARIAKVPGPGFGETATAA